MYLYPLLLCRIKIVFMLNVSRHQSTVCSSISKKSQFLFLIFLFQIRTRSFCLFVQPCPMFTCCRLMASAQTTQTSCDRWSLYSGSLITSGPGDAVMSSSSVHRRVCLVKSLWYLCGERSNWKQILFNFVSRVYRL